eukprot:m.1387760 g.1387760  ORF g.1387760 m.1387760 type:complete len:304 (-) comp24984_c0_seq5:927-1838(-)
MPPHRAQCACVCVRFPVVSDNRHNNHYYTKYSSETLHCQHKEFCRVFHSSNPCITNCQTSAPHDRHTCNEGISTFVKEQNARKFWIHVLLPACVQPQRDMHALRHQSHCTNPLFRVQQCACLVATTAFRCQRVLSASLSLVALHEEFLERLWSLCRRPCGGHPALPRLVLAQLPDGFVCRPLCELQIRHSFLQANRLGGCHHVLHNLTLPQCDHGFNRRDVELLRLIVARTRNPDPLSTKNIFRQAIQSFDFLRGCLVFHGQSTQCVRHLNVVAHRSLGPRRCLGGGGSRCRCFLKNFRVRGI